MDPVTASMIMGGISGGLSLGSNIIGGIAGGKAAKAADAQADGSNQSTKKQGYYQQYQQDTANLPYQQLGYSAIPLYNWLSTGQKPQLSWGDAQEQEYNSLLGQEQALKDRYAEYAGYSGSNKKVYAVARSEMTKAQAALARINELRQQKTMAQSLGGFNDPLEAFGYNKNWKNEFQKQADDLYGGLEKRSSAYETTMLGREQDIVSNDQIQDQYQRNQGEKSINRALAARGMFNTRAGVDKLTDFNSGLDENIANAMRGRMVDRYNRSYALGNNVYDRMNALGTARYATNYGLNTDDWNRQQNTRQNMFNNLGNMINVGRNAAFQPMSIQPTQNMGTGAASGIARSNMWGNIGNTFGQIAGNALAPKTPTMGQYNPDYNNGMTPEQYRQANNIQYRQY